MNSHFFLFKSRSSRMSYTVLARKWRPKNFSELVGQSHVMQALSNALDQQRLHHAYLFTGTRGVGKTTIARIFAKALNCQEGISSHPCGVCDTCRSIDEGRFIDLIEVDAASKTKVDDTREILDNVQFAPTQGRYKVYLIDEVHMLSKSSFNALLKTLEEPPEHVKFLLATTDPHKLPITVLSRCLQFNLMRLTQPQIQNHLAFILTQEQVPFEDGALALIAKSADGSARDSLSLLDQAIAYGAGQVMFEPVQTMLGLVDQQFGVAILNALAADDAEQIKTVIQQLATMGVDYQALLSQLIETLHAISYVQVFADNETTTLLPTEIVQSFAQNFTPERVQLLYQVALLAKQDMQLAPDIRIGFEMALMRMLAFMPAESKELSEGQMTQITVKKNEPQNKSLENSTIEGAQLENPMDALAGLATARSLVGKKNAKINSTNSANEEISTQSKINSQVQTSATQKSHVQTASAQENVSTDRVSESDINYSIKVSSASIADTSSVAFDNTQTMSVAPEVSSATISSSDSDSDSDMANASQPKDSIAETVSHQNVASNSSHSDHLAQIRERLKQPFGNSSHKVSPVETDVSHAESQISAPKNLSDTLNDISSQFNNPQPVDVENSVSVEQAVSRVEMQSLDNIEPRSVNLESNLASNLVGNHNINADVSTPSDSHEPPSWALEDIPTAQDSVHLDAQNISGMDDSPVQMQPSVQKDQLNQAEQQEQRSASPAESTTILEQKTEITEFIASDNKLTDWITIIDTLELKGMAFEMARNSVLVELTDSVLAMSIDPNQQYAKPEMYFEQIAQAIKAKLGSDIELKIVETNTHETLAKFYAQQESNRLLEAQNSINNDGVVQQLVTTLGMQVITGSIKPV